jgi:uncharacterized membrane protein YbhN (UPF0104 family)
MTLLRFEALPLLAIAFVITLAHFVMEPWRWSICYMTASPQPGQRSRTRDVFFATALASYLLPFKLGVPLRMMLLNRVLGLTYAHIGVVIGIDGLISLVVWITSAAIAGWRLAVHWFSPWYLAGALGVLAIGAIALLLGRTRRVGLAHIRDVLMTLDRPMRRVTLAGGILVLDIASYALRHAALVWLVTGDALRAPTGAAAGVVATFAGIVSGLPLGLVGYDATLVALLSVSGVPPAEALAIALVNRLLNIGAAALLGIPASMRLGLGSGLSSIHARLRELARGKR